MKPTLKSESSELKKESTSLASKGAFRSILAKSAFFLSSNYENQCLETNIKDPLYVYLESKAQGHGITLKVYNVLLILCSRG